MAVLIISNEEMGDIMKIIKYLQEFSLLIKGITKTIENEAKKQRSGFLSMLSGTLGVISLQNMFVGKPLIGAGST